MRLSSGLRICFLVLASTGLYGLAFADFTVISDPQTGVTHHNVVVDQGMPATIPAAPDGSVLYVLPESTLTEGDHEVAFASQTSVTLSYTDDQGMSHALVQEGWTAYTTLPFNVERVGGPVTGLEIISEE